MAEFPAELSTGMVHGRFIVAVIDGEDGGQEPDVIPAQGKVAFKASVGYIPVPVATGGPVTVMKGPIMGVLDYDGYLCTPHPATGEPMYRGVRLISTDDPDMAVTGWTWNADYRLEAVNGNSMQIPAHSFALPSGAEVDLTTLVNVPSSPGYGLPQAEAAVLRAEAIAQSVRDDADAGMFNGEAATLEVGTVTSGATAEVVNVGDEHHAILNFTLEKGDTGTGVPDAGAPLQVMRMDSDGIATEWVTPSKEIVGLSNVDNTADADKPVSGPTEIALAEKADAEAVSLALDEKADLSEGKVPDTQIPARLQPLELSSTIDDRTTLFNELAVNVKRYGAKGNNSDDDTAAIQAAEAVANANTRPLYFPNGSYLYSHTITARVVVGESRQKTRLKYTGATDAVGNGGELAYHRRWEHLTIVGTGVGVGLNLNTSPAGSYRNMIVENFETGIYLDGGTSLYNVFDDVTVQSTVTGVKIDGLAHESRFKNFRINFAQIGIDVMGAGRTVIDSSSIENCTLYGVVIRDRGAGRNVATTMFSTRFEFNPVNIRIEPNVKKTAIIACHPVGGITEDLGIETIQINTNGDIITSGTVTTTGTVKGENVEATALKGDRVQAKASFNDARIQLVGTGTVIDRNVTGSGTALRVNLVNEAATGSVLDVQRQSNTVVRVGNLGHLVVCASAAPPAANLFTGEAAFWVDTTNGSAKLMVTAKQADGTVKSGNIPLT